jgi:predicted enzyme related to lactoylglutathione lyase
VSSAQASGRPKRSNAAVSLSGSAGCSGRRAITSLGGALGGGIVECATARSVWLPYVEVAEITEVTDRARLLGASILLEPREGAAGWRSVVATRAGGEVAFWQPKR